MLQNGNMFGGQQKTPIIIKLIVGKVGARDPHSQNFQNMFASVPGLKIYSLISIDSQKYFAYYIKSSDQY